MRVKQLPKEKIFLTGVNGFIARNIRKHLECKYEIHGVDRFVLNDPMALQMAVQMIEPDYIIHLAAYGNHYDQQDEEEMITANIIKTDLVLQVTKDIPYKCFVNVSTSSVYGKKDKPMSEDMLPETDTFYGATKLAGEYLCRAFAKKYRKPIVNVRPFSVYGDFEASHRFIPQIKNSIRTGETMYIDPKPMHDWIHVIDFVKGVETVMLNPDKLGNRLAINIGTGKQYPNEEVLDKVQWVMDGRANVEYKQSLRAFDSDSWVADNSALKSLGWSPEFDLMKGIRKTCNVQHKEC